MHNSTISYAVESERKRVLNTISLAFAADPLMRWIYPSADQYLEYYQVMSDAFAGKSINENTCLRTSNCEGAAMWLAPGIEPDEDTLMALITESLTPHRAEVIGELFERMDEFHPTDDDCWYLAIIGVDPGHQNKGIGSALMQHMIEKLDATNSLAYLESSSPMNISLYQRYGFEIMDEIQVADSPILTPMLRPRAKP